jgi:6-phosphogluconolactonase
MDATSVTMERVRDNDACAKALADAVETASREAIEKRGTFAVALAGGSLAKALGALREETRRVEWDKWRVFWVDERCVKWDDEESNFGGAMRALFGDVSVKRERLYAVDETLCERNEGAAKPCAEAYERDLRALTPDVIELNEDGLPVFDMLLLGFGPDGHICSLFPNHALLRETEGWILPIADSPKPPPERRSSESFCRLRCGKSRNDGSNIGRGAARWLRARRLGHRGRAMDRRRRRGFENEKQLIMSLLFVINHVSTSRAVVAVFCSSSESASNIVPRSALQGVSSMSRL